MGEANPEVNYDVQEGDPSIMNQGKMVNNIDDTGTLDLRSLCINNIVMKLRNPGQYDIGGCRQQSLDLWFFFTTTICPGGNYLLNLFVCNLKPSFVSLDICLKSRLNVMEKECSLLPEVFENVSLIKNQGNNHLRTYRFTELQIMLMEAKGSILQIPIKVNVCSEFSIQDIHPSIKNKIKLEHSLGSLLLKDNKYDYAFISRSGNKHNVHKIVLIAHSPVLKEVIHNSKDNFLALDLDDNCVQVIVNFLYTGTFEKKHQGRFCFKQLSDVAEEFKIHNLSSYLHLNFSKSQ